MTSMAEVVCTWCARLLLSAVAVRVIRGYERKSKVATGVAAKASATVHDGTAKAFLYSGLFDCVEMRSEWNADNHRVCKQLRSRSAMCTSVSSSRLLSPSGAAVRFGVRALRASSTDKFKLVKQRSGATGSHHVAGGAPEPAQAPTFQGTATRKRKAFRHRVDRSSGKRVKYNGTMCEDISNGTELLPVPALNSVDT